MPTTVFFATNRAVNGDPANPLSYTASIQSPASPANMVYGTAFVDGIDLDTNAQGVISSIYETALGQFPPSAAGDLAQAGRNLLVFIHGFDNSFSDAITRAAFNREWLAASKLPGTDTTVIAFSWPSLGHAVSFPVPWEDYLTDQKTAGQSGYHLMEFLATLEPLLEAAQNSGQSTFLLAHSMGNLALESAVAQWSRDGNGKGHLFDCVVLAAGDVEYDTFQKPATEGMARLNGLTDRISIYASRDDAVLDLSHVINSDERLGQTGPLDSGDAALFPPAVFQMVDATHFRGYDFNLLTSHQYYRLSPECRTVIAADMAGSGAAGAV